ncbi:restriction endonuclease subunit S [Halomonas elongata]|uniref:restriction endonuclease subunit S n=1 Tax=Halomonas elongata TaxID=2746 RepID=UPI00186B9B78|nr:restriction endonuclease subunit S [Halomonas elongata]MBW5800044.1 restriction endonuclease subunit S [Halomonas elongata]
MSAQELITDHLDLWTGAVTHKSGTGRSASGKNGKIELTGIKKLRELILELAVRGKLVEQDPSDEPASVLLERVAEEKARLVKEGKVKKSQAIPTAVGSADIHDAPKGWALTTLAAIGYWAIGNGFPKQEQGESGGEVLFCKVSDMNLSENSREILKTKNTVSNEAAKRMRLKLHQPGTVIFPKIGGAISTNKRRIIVRPTAIDNNCLGITPSCGILSDYLLLFLTSVDMTEYQAGTSVPALSQSAIGKIGLCLPPLGEQRRIAKKVDELMAICDRLERQVGDQLEAHEVLVDTLLAALTRSVDAAEVAENWARVAEHFDTLFTTEANIDKLKKTILQLAVIGRLVEQDPNDEPASLLLDKIAEEKARLVKEEKIKKPKRLPPIENNERSYQVHENWAWVRFQNIANEISTGPFGSMIHKHDYINNGVPLINPSHMINGSIQEDVSVSISPQKAEELSSYKLNESDIVMARRGEVGRCAIVSDREAGWLCGTGSFVLRFHEALSRRFILMMFATDGVRRYLAGNSVGTTMTNLNHGILNRMPVALPPINEQHRIVQKVDELMALCDQLKKRLSESGKTRSQLAETVVEQAVS